MEYFLGSLITIVVVILANKYLKAKVVTPIKKIRHSQSNAFQLIVGFVEYLTEPEPMMLTQSLSYHNKQSKKVFVLENNAYWIDENTFYVADMFDDGIDLSSAKQVDIMSMDKVQLEKMIYIVEQLREGMPNDSWDSGQSKF